MYLLHVTRLGILLAVISLRVVKTSGSLSIKGHCAIIFILIDMVA